jgi:hypothetical protein
VDTPLVETISVGSIVLAAPSRASAGLNARYGPPVGWLLVLASFC